VAEHLTGDAAQPGHLGEETVVGERAPAPYPLPRQVRRVARAEVEPARGRCTLGGQHAGGLAGEDAAHAVAVEGVGAVRAADERLGQLARLEGGRFTDPVLAAGKLDGLGPQSRW
jgi:hypothetical protein